MAKSKSKAQAQNGSIPEPDEGPASANEISWPEVLKDHVSLMEDHYKLIEALWSHAQTTRGHRAIAGCLDRAKKALEDSRTAVKSFGVPVVQGDDMGADHIPLESHSNFNFESVLPNRTDAADTKTASEATNGQASKPMFVIDTNPMPVKLKGISNKHNKRGGSPHGDGSSEEPRRSKRTKTESRSTELNGDEIEREDITETVEARLKEKASRREEVSGPNGKKRKRDTESSSVEDSESEPEGATGDESKRPKKKKKKKNGVNNHAKIRREARKKKKMEKKEQKRLRKEASALKKPKKNKEKYKKKKPIVPA